MPHFSKPGKYKPFVFTVDTRLPGSANNTFTLPLTISTAYAYNCVVEWGDGSREKIATPTVAANPHVYATPGIYMIKIHGRGNGRKFGKLALDAALDAAKVISINSYGDILWVGNAFNTAYRGAVNLATVDFSKTCLSQGVVNLNGMFSGCTAFNSEVNFDSKGVTTNMNSTFLNCTSFNKPVKLDTSRMTSMTSTFSGCTAFKQSLAHFNISELTVATNMLSGCDINEPGTTANYDATLNSWAAQSIRSNVVFNAGNSRYSLAAATAREDLVSAGWTITDGGLA